MGKTRKSSAMNAAQKVIRETFEGLPIEDAVADFSLLVKTSDITAAKGQEKDFSNCILAKACARQVNATKVAFMRQVAYLELPDAKGKKRLVRYMLDKDAAAIVAAFDRGKAVKGEVLVTLKAPTPSQTLDVLREKFRRNAAKHRQAIIQGKILDKDMDRVRYVAKPRVKRLDVRNGTGMVHNILKKTEKSR
jgi:hypothetical protein